MNRDTDFINIATRESPLAMWQAHTTQQLLQNLGCANVKLLPMTTTGDKWQNTKLSFVEIEHQLKEKHVNTGKGLFIKEIQEALLTKKAHLAVHSMKDLPITQTEELLLSALLPRAASADVLLLSPEVLNETELIRFSSAKRSSLSFAMLKEYLLQSPTFMNGQIGTTSLRRQLLLKRHLHPSLNTVVLRGNVDSRLKKLRDNQFSAILLAEAGLSRLGLYPSPDMFALPKELFIPSAAQGVIAIETHTKNKSLQKILQNLNCFDTCLQAGIERLVLFLLDGGCHSAIGIYFANPTLHLFYADEVVSMIPISTQFSITKEELSEVSLFLQETQGNYGHFFERLKTSSLAKKLNEKLQALL